MKNLNRTVSKIGHYTIVEMMMVIAIFMIILSMTMVAWLNSGDQAKLRNAARLVSAQLNLARAKAVADCKEVGVYFSNTGNAREKYAMLICEKGDKSKRIPGEDWVQLPGGILFSANQPDDNPVSATAPGAIKFRSDGSLTQDSNRADFYLAPGDAKNSKLNKDAVSYYKIEINEFTGRSKLTYIETED